MAWRNRRGLRLPFARLLGRVGAAMTKQEKRRAASWNQPRVAKAENGEAWWYGEPEGISIYARSANGSVVCRISRKMIERYVAEVPTRQLVRERKGRGKRG